MTTQIDQPLPYSVEAMSTVHCLYIYREYNSNFLPNIMIKFNGITINDTGYTLPTNTYSNTCI